LLNSIFFDLTVSKVLKFNFALYDTVASSEDRAMLESNLSVALVTEAWEAVSADAEHRLSYFPHALVSMR